MLLILLLLALASVQDSSCGIFEGENLPEKERKTRQINLGSLLSPITNQAHHKAIHCEAPSGQKGKCLPIEKCVIKELDEDYVKHKGYLCALGTHGPVGVCCPNSITKPTLYREGMFGHKDTFSGKTGDADSELIQPLADATIDCETE